MLQRTNGTAMLHSTSSLKRFTDHLKHGDLLMPTKTTAKTFEAAMEPMVEFNGLVTKTLEESFNLQMASMQAYTKIGMENVKAGLKVRTVDDMASYAEMQKELAQKTSDMMMSDAKAMAAMGNKFMESSKTMMEGNMKTAAAAAADMTKVA